jgi:tetrahydromethanopterin S-methyltransferase subunit G
MTSDPYTELIEFLGRKFEAIERRLDAMEHRLAVLEVGHEAIRGDIRALADGQAVINARLDRVESRVEALEGHLDRSEVETRARFDGIETRLERFEVETRARFGGIETRFDRFEVDFGTVVLDHGRRIQGLEGSDPN